MARISAARRRLRETNLFGILDEDVRGLRRMRGTTLDEVTVRPDLSAGLLIQPRAMSPIGKPMRAMGKPASSWSTRP